MLDDALMKGRPWKKQKNDVQPHTFPTRQVEQAKISPSNF